jgi:hypothetical protein
VRKNTDPMSNLDLEDKKRENNKKFSGALSTSGASGANIDD